MKNELRIGNYVYYRGNIEKCFALRNSGVDFYRGKTKKGIITQGYTYDAIQPIPLTEEILLKCGFENWHGKEYSLCNGLFYMNFKFYKNGNIQLITCGSSKKYLKGEIMLIAYLHQLQNLYFALTNEELTVNL